MEGRVGHLHNIYRVAEARGGGGALAARLEAVSRERLGVALGEALDAAFAGDETVYVMRRVEARALLVVGKGATDAAVSRRWGERLAAAVARRVADDAGDGENLVRFDSRADYLACFVAALVSGTAWGGWHFGAFARFRHLTQPDALREALLEYRAHLPRVLGLLHARGELEAFLDALDAETRRALWRDGLSPAPRTDPDALRPIFSDALRLVDKLEAWAGARHASAPLFESYLADAPAAADWNDPRAMARAFLDVLRFLAQRGHLRRVVPRDEGFDARLDKSLDGLDWLDAEWLRGALSELFGETETVATLTPSITARRGTTPRQRKLLSALSSLADAVPFGLSERDTDADALRFFAALVGRDARWAEDAAAKVLIEHLLSARDALRRANDPGELIGRLRRGDAPGALSILVQGESAAVSAALKFVAEAGGDALDLLDKLAGGARKTRGARAGVESVCAGVSLLWRTMLDARLHELAERTQYPAGALELSRLHALLLALGMRLGGEEETDGDAVEEGLCLLAGLMTAPSCDELREAWAATDAGGHARFQGALLNVLSGQRLLSASVMHLFRVPLAGVETALIAGDETAQLWPLGCRIADGGEIEAVAARWLEVFGSAMRVRPSVVVADESLAAHIESLRERAVFEVIAAPEVERASPNGEADGPETEVGNVRDRKESHARATELLAAHGAGRVALISAFESLERGRLGLPDADLTLGLAACALLRMWARWLRQFSSSSVPYLLENFIRRPGRLSAGADGLVVELRRGPLDIVAEMAGYFAELERVPWLKAWGGRVRFSLWGV